MTRNLWEKTYFVPARPAQVRLYESQYPPGILVEYDERIAGGRPTGRRAYWLHASTNVPPGQPPPFLRSMGEADGLKAIPIIKHGQGSTVPGAQGYAAVERPEEHEFTLYADGVPVGTHKLPFYWKATRSLGRALLTPVAVAADAAYTVGTFGVLGAAATGGYGGWVPPP